MDDVSSSMIRKSVLTLLAALATALALLASGCGGAAAEAHDLSSFDTVFAATAATESSRFSMQVKATIPGVDEPLAFGAEGGYDAKLKRADISADLSGIAGLVKSLGPALGAGDLPQGDDWKLQVIMDGTELYLRFPLIDKELPAGKKWVRADLKELATQSGQLGQLGSFADTTPKDVLGFLKAVSGGIETVGSETIRGTETSHYRASIDLEKLVALVPAEQRKGLNGLDGALEGSGLQKLPIDVWIDGDNRVRKLELAVTMPASGAAAGTSISFTMEMYDYGAPIEIVLPPIEEITDASNLPHS